MPHLPPHPHPTCCWLRSRARNAHSRLPLGQASSSGRETHQAPHPTRPTLVLETGDGPQLFKASMELHDSHPRLLPPWAQPGNSLYLGCVPTWVRVSPGCGALHCVPPLGEGPSCCLDLSHMPLVPSMKAISGAGYLRTRKPWGPHQGCSGHPKKLNLQKDPPLHGRWWSAWHADK